MIHLRNIQTDLSYWTSTCDGCGNNFWDASNVFFFFSFGWFWVHTLMYFFFSHLFFRDLCYSTAVEPRMLVGFIVKKKETPFYGCTRQFLISCTFADSVCLLLAVMARDGHKGISNSLLYMVNMSNNVCSLLMVEMADALVFMTVTSHLCFCGLNEINHFFCDNSPLFLLSCSDI